MTTDKTVILPAAGFGRRVGSPEAKELLPHPRTGRTLMQEALDRIPSDVMSHVIVRKEKIALTQFLATTGARVQIVEPTEEWAETVLKSQSHWTERNVLHLPDTEFEPSDTIVRLFDKLDTHPVAFAGFHVPDPQHWGLVNFTPDGFEIGEKPTHTMTGWAWGLIGFRRTHGVELFEKILQGHRSKEWQVLRAPAARIELEHFHDLTRPLATAPQSKAP